VPDLLCTIQEGIHQGCLQLGRCGISHGAAPARFLSTYQTVIHQQFEIDIIHIGLEHPPFAVIYNCYVWFFLPKPWAFHIYVGMGWYGQLFAQQSTHSLDNRQYSTVWGVDNLYNNLKQFWVVHIIH
jgi:hypothetical protein